MNRVSVYNEKIQPKATRFDFVIVPPLFYRPKKEAMPTCLSPRASSRTASFVFRFFCACLVCCALGGTFADDDDAPSCGVAFSASRTRLRAAVCHMRNDHIGVV